MINSKDALGNDIVFGNKYGWSNDSNGITSVKIGIAVKQTSKGGITINNIVAKSALWFDEAKTITHNGSANVKPIKLFPICN